MVAREEGNGNGDEKVKENKRYKFPVIKLTSYREMMYSIGKAVNNIIITLMVTEGDHIVRNINIESVCCKT